MIRDLLLSSGVYPLIFKSLEFTFLGTAVLINSAQRGPLKWWFLGTWAWQVPQSALANVTPSSVLQLVENFITVRTGKSENSSLGTRISQVFKFRGAAFRYFTNKSGIKSTAQISVLVIVMFFILVCWLIAHRGSFSKTYFGVPGPDKSINIHPRNV